MPKDSEGREPGEEGYTAPADGEKKKGGNLLQKFNSSPLWVKIGAIAAVAGVGLMWYLGNRNSQSANSTGVQSAGVMTGGSGTPTDYIGEGDIYPSAVNTTGSTGTTTSQPAGIAANVKQVGYFASTAGGTNNGGANYGQLAPGQSVQLLSASPASFKNVNYYQVSSNGQTGYVRGSTIGLP